MPRGQKIGCFWRMTFERGDIPEEDHFIDMENQIVLTADEPYCRIAGYTLVERDSRWAIRRRIFDEPTVVMLFLGDLST
jgi:hypothetical protein